MNKATHNFLTVVSGLPRSGTSMMMRMLEHGGMPVLVDHVRKPDEDNPGGYYEFEAVKKTKDDPSWLENSAGRAVKMVYRLLYDLPKDREYRVLFMRRDLDEVLASQRVMMERTGLSKENVSDEQMAQLFIAELNAFYKWVEKQPDMSLLDVDYNRMQQHPSSEAERVNKFLGGGLDVQAMIAIVDNSLYRNRKAAKSFA